MRTHLPRVLTTLLIAWAIAATPAAAQEKEDTPLQSRAKALLQSFSQAKTKDAQIEIRTRLVAMADTLESAGDDALASHCLERAGMVGYRLSEYDNAIAQWERGVAAARRSGDRKRIAALLNAQAVGVSVTGDNERAIELQMELLALRREMEDVRGEGGTWHNLAYSYVALFRFPEAIDAISNALRLHREAGNSGGIAASMTLLSNTLSAVGKNAEALEMADSAVVRCRATGNPNFLGTALQGRARILHYAGRYEEAIADYEEAHDVLVSAGFARMLFGNDTNWADVLISLGRCEAAQTVMLGTLEQAQDADSGPNVMWNKCVDARITARCADAEAGRKALLAAIESLEAARDAVAGELSRADAYRMGGGAYTDLALLEIREAQPEAAWRATEASTARLFHEGLGVQALASLDAFQAELAAIDAIAIQFGHSTVDRNVVCVITPDAVEAFPLEITKGFRNDIETALQLMSSNASDEDCQPALSRIADAALGPVATAFDAAGDRLVILAGEMAGLPFEALPLPGGDGTLGDRYAISYAPSATAFLALQSREPSAESVIVFADPDLGTTTASELEVAMRSTRMSLAPLPDARAEGAAVATTGTLLVGTDATPEAFLANAADAGVVHVAAHAIVDAAHPDYSGIVLAGPDGGELVTVAQLKDLSLQTDLVSLSGCETAGGYVATGDGAFGLTRAFLLAGARSVVSSWWAVEDGAARRFMELFYAGLRDGEARDIAMRDARKQMAEEGFSHRDRTAFALTGATAQPVAAIAAQSSPFSTKSIVFVVVVVIGIIAVIVVGRRHAQSA